MSILKVPYPAACYSKTKGKLACPKIKTFPASLVKDSHRSSDKVKCLPVAKTSNCREGGVVYHPLGDTPKT